MLILISKHASAVTREVKMKVTVMPGYTRLYHDQYISEKISVAVQVLALYPGHPMFCHVAKTPGVPVRTYTATMRSPMQAGRDTAVHLKTKAPQVMSYTYTLIHTCT